MTAKTDWRDVVKLPILHALKHGWSLGSLEDRLLKANEDCANLCKARNGGQIDMCLSGGIDSSLSLAMMRSLFPEATINVYTIAESGDHPDWMHAKQVAAHFHAVFHGSIPTVEAIATNRDELEILTGKKETLGSVGVFMLYRYAACNRISVMVAHDGIDELMGGYWAHRSQPSIETMYHAFCRSWDRLAADHLLPLMIKAAFYGITPVFPYLQKDAVEYITGIPLDARTSRQESKMPLRALAKKYGVPQEVIERKKIGFCDALKEV